MYDNELGQLLGTAIKLYSQSVNCFPTAATTRTKSSCIHTSCVAMTTPLIPLAVRVIPSDRLYVSEPNPISFGNVDNPPVDVPFWTYDNWLHTLFHFSFGKDYDNPHNERFGVLRVVNDDTVQAERGFSTHEHRDMEIITYVVEGELTHNDSMGNSETLTRGSIQYMSGGTGVEHSEHNHHETKPMRCIQTWIYPNQYGLRPRYGSYTCLGPEGSSSKVRDPAWGNKLKHLVTDIQSSYDDVPVKIHQDVDVHVAELEIGAQVTLRLTPNRQAYLVCIEGGVSVSIDPLHEHAVSSSVDDDDDEVSTPTPAVIACSNQHYRMTKHDGCEITGNAGGLLSITSTESESTENGELAHVILYVMPSVPNSGRTDF